MNLIAPYLACMRQDKRFHDGESVTSRSFARLVSSTFDKLLTVDPHLHRYPTLSAVYTIPTITLHAAPLLADWIAGSCRRTFDRGPRRGKRAVGQRHRVPHRRTARCARKTRHGDRSVDIDVPDLSSGAAERRCWWTTSHHQAARSPSRRASSPSKGMRKPECVVVHALFAEDAWAQLTPLFARITSTDAVPHPSNRIGLPLR